MRNWKTAYVVCFAGRVRFNAVRAAVVSGHVTLSGQVISALDRETAEQTIRRLRGVVGVTNCIIASLPDPPNSLQNSLRCAPQPTLGNYGTNDEAK